MKLCIVSPHIDDALLSCGILMQRHVAAGDEVFVLDIFSAGTNSENRKKEEMRAQAIIGAKPVFLDELDAPDRDARYRSEQEIFFGELNSGHAPYIDKVAARIRAFFSEHQISLALFPLAAGTHIDHRIAHEAGRGMTGTPVRFYEDRPYILWQGVLQGRMNMLGCDAVLPKVTAQKMRETVNDYHYLTHFVPEGDYQDKTLPLYAAAAAIETTGNLKAKGETLLATETELKKLYDALAAYDSQMKFIYDSYETFIRDSLAYERALSGKAAYIERSWILG